MSRVTALRYALAPACVALAVLLHLSPAGALFHPTGLFVLAVLAAGWFGGAAVGFIAAALATLTLPQLIPMSYALLGGFFDLPRFITFAITGLAVGWGANRFRRAEAALRQSEHQLESGVAERTAALRLSEERYARALQAAKDGIWEWNPATDEIFMSERARQLWGVPDGVEVRTRAELKKAGGFHPEDLQRTEDEIAASRLPGARGFDMEYRVTNRDGELRWVRSQGKAFPGVDGQPALLTGSLTDITERKLTEDALRASEERFALALSASNDGIWDWDLVTDEQFFSEHAQRIFGYQPGPTLRQRSEWHALREFHPDDEPRRMEAVRRHLAGETAAYEGDWRVRPVGGEYRWVHTRGVCVRDAAGQPIRMVGSITDIDARKRAEDALRESEKRYERAMLAVEAGFWDWDVTADEFHVSPRLLRMGGFPAGTTFAGRADFMQRAPFHPEDRDNWQREVKALFASGGSRLSRELRVIIGGETRWYRLDGMCFRDAEGRVVRWTGSSIDVTERRRAEEALRESEKRYALAVAGSEDGIWDVDFAARRVFVSARARELAGLPSGPESVPMDEYFAALPLHPDDVPRRVAAMQAHLAGETPAYEGEFRLRQADGVYRWRRIHGLCVRGADGKPHRMAGSISDIDARKLAEEAVRRSEERYSLAMKASDEGYIDVNVDTDEVVVSERAIEIIGLPRGTRFSTIGEYVAALRFYGNDLEVYRTATRDAVARGGDEHYEFEVRIVWPSGEVRWLWSRGNVVRDAEGHARRRIAVLADITERKRGAEALRDSEARFRALAESALAGIYLIQENRFRYVNPAMATMFGYTPEELVDRLGPADLVHADDRALVAENIRRRVEREVDEIRYEFRGVRRDGSVFPVEVHGRRIEFGGKPGVMGALVDNTERKRAVDELRESEARFRCLTELSSDWYWEQDENLRFTYLSNQAAQLTGYSGESSLGKTRWEIANITPLTCSWAEHQAVLAARKPFRDLECRRVGPDGTVRYLSISGAPVFDQNGRFKGYQGIGRNITERKRIEEDLRSRQEMLQLAQQSARAVAFDWNAEREQPWPPDLEAMYGVAPSTFPGSFRPFGLERQDWKKLVHPDDWPTVTAAIEHAYSTGDVAAEYRVIHADGSVRWLQSKGRMFFDAEKKPVRMVGLIQDVTALRHAEEELKTMERRLRQAQRLEAMGTLAGGIAHDFNNILGAILGYGEMALRDALKGSRLRRDLDSIMAAGERGRALVDRVLAFSRSGVGERVPVHVEKVVREALDLVSAKLPPEVTLHAKLHAGPAAMLGDATQVHQVLMNLATNAIQAMPSGGTLRVSLRAVRIETTRAPTIGTISPGDYLVLEVADTGTGIAPEIFDRIFDPFFTTKEVGTGTGLGLSLVHGIVVELGGAIDVASRHGAGTIFTVYLPHCGEAPATDAQEELAMPRGAGQRVLVVDDEEPLVKLATRTLEELGYAPIGFTSSTKALAAFRADPKRFDAVITDERMPGMSGSALIREVRGIRGSIPIVMMSGYIGGAVASRAREAGAEEVLKKPLSARDLAASLARVLES